MRPFDKFKEIDARLAALEAESSELKARVKALEPKPLGEPVSYEDAMAQIDAGKARLTDFVWTLPDYELAKDPWPGAVPMEPADGMPAVFGTFPTEPAPGVEIIEGQVQIYEWRRDQLTAPIVDAKPIASATIAPLPAKRRGRPPKTA